MEKRIDIYTKGKLVATIVPLKEFDHIQEVSKWLKAIFRRDGWAYSPQYPEGMEDYIVRSVEEAQELANQAPAWIYWKCEACDGMNIYTNAQCSHCGKPRGLK